MDIYVLNPKDSFKQVAVIDSFSSLIWTTRYYGYGDFELYMPADTSLLDILKPDLFLVREDDTSVMVLEKMKIQTDAENGDYFILTGRSLESILLRRIFSRQFVLNNTGTLAEAVQAMLTECTTNHEGGLTPTFRQFTNLYVDLTPDYSGTMNVQFTGQTLYYGIVSICQPLEIGFRITLTGTTMLLSVYKGNETEVIFSPEFDNLINSNYVFNKMDFSNCVLVGGEGEGSDRSFVRIIRGTRLNPPSDLDLREMFVDARDISSNNGEISYSDYTKMLIARGDEKLTEHSVDESFEAEIEPQMTFKYKQDYNLGDVVTVKNEYGVTAHPRIVEIIESWDQTGYKVIPTFDKLQVS